MADEETREGPRRRRRARQDDDSGELSDREKVPEGDQVDTEGAAADASDIDAASEHRDGPSPPSEGDIAATGGGGVAGDEAVRSAGVPAATAARRAAAYVAALTRRDPESVISIERRDGDWQIGVEVVESHRIPDSADILAIYEVRLRADGEFTSYRRTRRYARGQLYRKCR